MSERQSRTSRKLAARFTALLLGPFACSCYGVVGEDGPLTPPSDDAGPTTPTGSGNGSGPATTAGNSTSTGTTSTGSGGAGGATGTGAGGSTGTGTGGAGSGGATGTGGAGGTTGAGGTGGAAGSGGTAAGGAAGTAGGIGGTAGSGGAAGTTGGTTDAGAGKGGASGGAGASGAAGAGGSGTLDAAVPPVCTSMTNWTSGNNDRMRPGDACRSCHSNFTIAGTVYPTLHEPLNCNGKSAVQVVITPASGTALTLTTNSAGNFYSTTRITTPYSAKVVVNGAERAMTAKQTSGDCNSCHTQNGAQSAPGRIMVP